MPHKNVFINNWSWKNNITFCFHYNYLIIFCEFNLWFNKGLKFLKQDGFVFTQQKNIGVCVCVSQWGRPKTECGHCKGKHDFRNYDKEIGKNIFYNSLQKTVTIVRTR